MNVSKKNINGRVSRPCLTAVPDLLETRIPLARVATLLALVALGDARLREVDQPRRRQLAQEGH
jgi:hypothetical protein